MSLESSEEFLRFFERVSKSIIFWGCGVSKDVEGCIEKRIRSALRHRKRQHKEAKSEKDKRFFKNKIRKLNNLLEHDFANRVDRSIECTVLYA